MGDEGAVSEAPGDAVASRLGTRFTRRTFLTGSAATALLVTLRRDRAIRYALDHGAGLLVSDEAIDPHQIGARPILTLHVDRDTDLFQADFTFYGFTVDKTSSPPSLVATATANSDLWVGVVVQLPPQAIAEADYAYPVNPSSDSDLPFDPTPVLSSVSGPSQLAFTFNHGDVIPLPTMTAADLLDWSGWTLHVQPAAEMGSGASGPRAPAPIETGIECPYAMYLAPVVPDPGKPATFATTMDARTAPFTHQGVTECWTATLTGTRVGQKSGYLPSVAAVWASDYGSGTSATLPPSVFILYEEYIPPPPSPRDRAGAR